MSTSRVTVYIPSGLPDSQASINTTLAGMARIAGGASAAHIAGAWIMADGRLCTEPITTVYSLSDATTFPALRAYAMGQAEALRISLGQEAVLVTVDAVPEMLLINGSGNNIAA